MTVDWSEWRNNYRIGEAFVCCGGVVGVGEVVLPERIHWQGGCALRVGGTIPHTVVQDRTKKKKKKASQMLPLLCSHILICREMNKSLRLPRPGAGLAPVSSPQWRNDSLSTMSPKQSLLPASCFSQHLLGCVWRALQCLSFHHGAQPPELVTQQVSTHWHVSRALHCFLVGSGHNNKSNTLNPPSVMYSLWVVKGEQEGHQSYITALLSSQSEIHRLKENYTTNSDHWVLFGWILK